MLIFTTMLLLLKMLIYVPVLEWSNENFVLTIELFTQATIAKEKLLEVLQKLSPDFSPTKVESRDPITARISLACTSS